MPTNYTVKQGDTLSKIASQYGVPTSQISGYKSGNPNLIYPGEQLVIPTASPQQSQLTPEQIKAGYSTIQGPYNPVTGKLNVSATGLTGEPQINTDVVNKLPTPTTSPYTSDIAALLAQQKQLVESAQGTKVPTLGDMANTLGYNTAQAAADSLITEINALNQQLADLNNQEQKAIGQYINQNVSQGFSLGMEGRIKRQYAIEKSAVSANLGVKVALAEMLQGKADKMWSHAQDIVNDLAAKEDADVKDMERFYTLNKDTLSYLTDKEKEYLNNVREDVKLTAQNAREDYTNKVSSIMNAAAKGLDVSAISGDDIMNKSYEEIATMISNAAQRKLAQDRAHELALKATTAGGGSGFGSGIDSTLMDSYINQVTTRQIDLNSSTINQDLRTAIATEMARRGIPIPKALTAAQKNAQEGASSGLNAISQLTSVLTTTDENGNIKIKPGANKILLAGQLGAASSLAGGGATRNMLREVADVKTRVRTGAALNEQEIAFYGNQVPIWTDPDSVKIQKIKQLQAFYAGVSGMPITITNPSTGESYTAYDMYDPQERLKVRNAITSGWNLILPTLSGGTSNTQTSSGSSTSSVSTSGSNVSTSGSSYTSSSGKNYILPF